MAGQQHAYAAADHVQTLARFVVNLDSTQVPHANRHRILCNDGGAQVLGRSTNPGNIWMAHTLSVDTYCGIVLGLPLISQPVRVPAPRGAWPAAILSHAATISSHAAASLANTAAAATR